jgi:hypothetical protein
MKRALFTMLLMVLPAWLASAFTDEGDGKAPAVKTYVAVGKEDGSMEVSPHVVRLAGGDGHAYVIAKGEGEKCCEGDEECEQKCKKIELITRVGEGDAKTGGWLGVSIGETPEALVDQLDLEGRGVMILNVVKDGPAEEAGLKAHDIIISVGGEEAVDDVTKVVKMVSSREPGEEVNIDVLRSGEEKTFTVKLGSRADMDKFVWVHKGDPLAEIEERIVTRGIGLRRGPDDEWIIEDLGDLDELAGLSDKIKAFIPKGQNRSVQVFVDGNRKSVKTKVEEDGTVIAIEQEDEGEITVSRVDENGEETEEVYADEEELAAADPEAYELYKSAGESVVIDLNLKGLGDLDVDLEELHEDAAEWRSELHEQLEEAGEAYHEAMEAAHEAIREWLEQWEEGRADGRSESVAPFVMPPKLPPIGSFYTTDLRRLGKPQHTFTVKENGSIEARIRKGDSELVRVFADEEDMAERNPKLYEKYQKLLEVEE